MEISLKSTANNEPIQILTEAIKLGPFNAEEHTAFVESSREPIDLDLQPEQLEQMVNRKIIGLYREAMMRLKPEDITPEGVINEIVRGYREHQALNK